MRRAILGFCLCVLPIGGLAQAPFPKLKEPVKTYSAETKDWGVKAEATPKLDPLHAPTPTTIPGARVIKTVELKALLAENKKVVVIDVLDSQDRKSVPGAVWMSGAGASKFYDAEKGRFAKALEKVTAGDKGRPLVFLCLSSECWLSYNAALRALDAGYKDVIWYRGGTNSWRAAKLDWAPPERLAW